MRHNRLLGFHVVRSTVNTQFLWPQFTMDANARVARDPEHCLWNPSYPDAEYYLTEVQKYMFRNEELRHLRLAQFFRYFKHQEDEKTAKKKEKAPAMRTDEDTLNEEDEGAIEDDQCHRNYDLFSSRKGCQDTVACAETLRVKVQKAKRRHNRDFCVARSSFLEPCGKDKDAFYEQKLLLGLPWHCHRKPLTGQNTPTTRHDGFSKRVLRTHRSDCGGSV